MNIIEVKNISKAFVGKNFVIKALDNVSLFQAKDLLSGESQLLFIDLLVVFSDKWSTT